MAADQDDRAAQAAGSGVGQARTTLRHATCVAVGDAGLLIEGQSGAGKSDLALRLVTQAWTVPDIGSAIELVADDQVRLSVRRDTPQLPGRLWAEPPGTIAGLIEVRGLGPVALPFRGGVTIALHVALTAPDQPVPRLPDDPAAKIEIEGVQLSTVTVDARAASAPILVLLALRDHLARTADGGWA